MRITLAAILVALPLTWGCYAFQPVERTALPEPGTSVRVEVMPAAGSDLFVRSGGSENEGRQRFRGELLEWSADTLTVVSVSPGVSVRFDTLRIPSRYVSTVEAMELEGGKTALAVVGGGLVTAAIVATQFSATGGAPPSDGPGDDQGGFRLPLVRFAFPR